MSKFNKGRAYHGNGAVTDGKLTGSNELDCFCWYSCLQSKND